MHKAMSNSAQCPVPVTTKKYAGKKKRHTEKGTETEQETQLE